MPKTSCGILLYRGGADAIEVLLVHPGGPLWARKDAGAWTIPKGEPDPGEEPAAAARREFAEETGIPLAAATGHPDPPLHPLGEAVQKGGKRVVAFAIAGDLEPAELRSNLFEMEWPPRSGRRRSFPEIDRAAWFPLDEARARINPAQAVFLDRLAGRVARSE